MRETLSSRSERVLLIGSTRTLVVSLTPGCARPRGAGRSAGWFSLSLRFPTHFKSVRPSSSPARTRSPPGLRHLDARCAGTRVRAGANNTHRVWKPRSLFVQIESLSALSSNAARQPRTRLAISAWRPILGVERANSFYRDRPANYLEVASRLVPCCGLDYVDGVSKIAVLVGFAWPSSQHRPGLLSVGTVCVPCHNMHMPHDMHIVMHMHTCMACAKHRGGAHA